MLRFAESQFQQGQYDAALKEYQRYLFFFGGADDRVFHAVGDCYAKRSEWGKAEAFYDKAFYLALSDSSKLNELFSKAECFIRMSEYGMALTDLLGYTDSITGENYFRMQFYQGLCYFGLEEFRLAEDAFVRALGQGKDLEQNRIHQLFSERKKLYKPNPQTAYIMSMCIPGLGQFYAGDVKNGLNSLVLTAALAALGFHIALSQSVIDGIVIVVPWFQRYYQGGIIRAEKIATENRQERRAAQLDQMLEVIAGTKPR